MRSVLLRTLHTEHLGPIDHAELQLEPGLTVLTGETGVGKSLLVGALSLCLGASDDRGLARSDGLRVSAVFDDGEAELSLSRVGDVGGRLRAYLDGAPVSAAALRERGDALVAIFGQQESSRLRGSAESRRILDQFGDVDARRLDSARGRLRDLEARRLEAGGDPTSRQREREFLVFQAEEFARVAPISETELDETLLELRTLSTIRERASTLADAADTLDGESDLAAATVVAQAAKSVPPDGDLLSLRTRLDAATDEIRDVAAELRALLGSADLDGDRLGALERRAAELHQLARKYGGSLAGAIEENRRIAARIGELDGASVSLEAMDAEALALSREIDELSDEVGGARRRAADTMSAAVAAELDRVALESAQFLVSVAGRDGSDVEFQFTADRSRPLGPLGRLASGGELSRVMLAISLVVLDDNVVAVFDEIDAGIGGAVAHQIGECLGELARRQQVLVVTHLASVAARADHHLVVERTDGPDTPAVVREVRDDERVDEIARMLAGERALQESRALALELLRR